MSETDEILVRKARQARPGDLRAFDELLGRHQSRIQTNCRYLSGNGEDARDLAQEVMVKVFFNLDRFEERSSFGAWVGRIKVNHCLNHLRSQKGRNFVDLDTPGLEQDPALHHRHGADARVEARDRRERIACVLDGLADQLRVPLIMRDLDGMSYQEISDELDLGLSAVKMRIKRAREEFRAAYGPGVKDD